MMHGKNGVFSIISDFYLGAMILALEKGEGGSMSEWNGS
jgi:hypothetical protein